jgi:hypothetical protein
MLGGHGDLIAEAARYLGGIDLAVIAHSMLGNQKTAEKEWHASGCGPLCLCPHRLPCGGIVRIGSHCGTREVREMEA